MKKLIHQLLMPLNNGKLTCYFLIIFRFLIPNKPIIPFKLFKKKNKNKLSFNLTKQFIENNTIITNDNLSENTNKDDNCNTEDESPEHSNQINEEYDYKINGNNNQKNLTILSMLYEN